jgi:DnaJ-class molecular chaperone
LSVLGLGEDADRHQLRQRYSGLVRRYHPDKNGGDRAHEGKLGEVIEAYQLLRKSAAFA